MRARQAEQACAQLYLQQPYNEKVHSALERPLLCSLPLSAVVRARQLRRDAALWLLPYSANILTESGVRDGCSMQTPSQHDLHKARIWPRMGGITCSWYEGNAGFCPVQVLGSAALSFKCGHIS